MTDTERVRLSGDEDCEASKRYQAASRVRRRIREELLRDVRILDEHHEELLTELRGVVCPGDGEEDLAGEATEVEHDTGGRTPDRGGRTPGLTAEDTSPDTREGASGEESVTGGEATEVVDRDALREELPGQGDLLERRVDGVVAMWEVLRSRGTATRDDMLDVVDPDVVGYASRESVWSNAVKGRDTLRALPGVETPAPGRSEWRHEPDPSRETDPSRGGSMVKK